MLPTKANTAPFRRKNSQKVSASFLIASNALNGPRGRAGRGTRKGALGDPPPGRVHLPRQPAATRAPGRPPVAHGVLAPPCIPLSSLSLCSLSHTLPPYISPSLHPSLPLSPSLPPCLSPSRSRSVSAAPHQQRERFSPGNPAQREQLPCECPQPREQDGAVRPS